MNPATQAIRGVDARRVEVAAGGTSGAGPAAVRSDDGEELTK
jgi:hypothetical protein